MTDPQTIWLLILLLIWAIALFGGFATGTENPDTSRRMPLWTRMASSFTLVVAAWSIVLFLRESAYDRLAVFVAVGMSLGFVGDLFMAQLIRVGNHVLGGIFAFGVGHIAYISGLIAYMQAEKLDDNNSLIASLLAWLLFGLVGWYWIVFRGSERGVLHIAALPYSLLLASTAGLATAAALQSSEFVPFALGAALFLLSDLILAAQLFNGLHFKWISDVVWLTYGPGQMLIVFTLALANMGPS